MPSPIPIASTTPATIAETILEIKGLRTMTKTENKCQLVHHMVHRNCQYPGSQSSESSTSERLWTSPLAYYKSWNRQQHQPKASRPSHPIIVFQSQQHPVSYPTKIHHRHVQCHHRFRCSWINRNIESAQIHYKLHSLKAISGWIELIRITKKPIAIRTL